jgi:hypothetical protein
VNQPILRPVWLKPCWTPIPKRVVLMDALPKAGTLLAWAMERAGAVALCPKAKKPLDLERMAAAEAKRLRKAKR